MASAVQQAVATQQAVPPLVASYTTVTPVAISGSVTVQRFYPVAQVDYTPSGQNILTIEIATTQYIDPRNSALEFMVKITQAGVLVGAVSLQGGAYCFFTRHRVLNTSTQLYMIEQYNLLHKILDTWSTGRDQATGIDAIYAGKHPSDSAHFLASDPTGIVQMTWYDDGPGAFNQSILRVAPAVWGLTTAVFGFQAGGRAVLVGGANAGTEADLLMMGTNASKLMNGGAKLRVNINTDSYRYIFRIQPINPLLSSDKLLPMSEMGLVKLEFQLAPFANSVYCPNATATGYTLSNVSYVAHCVEMWGEFKLRLAAVAVSVGIRVDVPAWGQQLFIMPNTASQIIQITPQVSSLEAILAVPRDSAYLTGANVNSLRSSVLGLTSAWWQINGRNYPSLPMDFTVPFPDNPAGSEDRNSKVELFWENLKCFDMLGKTQVNNVLDYSNYQDPNGFIGLCLERYVGESGARMVGINTRTDQTIIYLNTRWIANGMRYADWADLCGGMPYYGVSTDFTNTAFANQIRPAFAATFPTIRWDVFYRFLCRMKFMKNAIEFQV